MVYFGDRNMSEWSFSLPRDLRVPDGTKYNVEVIDEIQQEIEELKDI